MIVRNFMQWAQNASAALRAEGAGALARAYLYSDLDGPVRREAELALTTLLDDPSPLVRRALAESFAAAPDAPRAVVAALANDQSEVAAPVLSRSPLLSEAQLIDCAAVGDAFAQTAIALRAHVPADLAGALAEIGAREAAIALAVNPGAELPEVVMRRMIERFGDHGELREALLARPSLPLAIRSQLVDATASALTAFVVDCAWLSPERGKRVAQEACDRAHVLIGVGADAYEMSDFVGYLRGAGRLTTSLLLRALLCGSRAFFAAALTELSGHRAERVAGHVQDHRGAGFAALYAKAGMPPRLLPAFRAALDAAAHYADTHRAGRLSLAMTRRVLAACEAANGGELDRLIALLRRFEVEAALDEARAARPLLAAALDPPRLPPPIDINALEAEICVAA